ncbi:MAG: hypothetical protein U0U67_16555 [Chitinophagales bacterium]
MVTTIVPSYMYSTDDDSIELTEKEKSEKEAELDFKLKFIPFTLVHSANESIAYSSLQDTKFALFAHFPDDEDHSSTLDFPPEFA